MKRSTPCCCVTIFYGLAEGPGLFLALVFPKVCIIRQQYRMSLQQLHFVFLWSEALSLLLDVFYFIKSLFESWIDWFVRNQNILEHCLSFRLTLFLYYPCTETTYCVVFNIGSTAYVLSYHQGVYQLWNAHTGEKFSVTDVYCPLQNIACLINNENVST